MSDKKAEASAKIGFRVAGSGFVISDEASATITRPVPNVLISAIVERSERVTDGHTIRALDPAWGRIAQIIRTNPSELYSLTPEQWEELIAASYDKAGFDEVILTPRSGDFGRDVIAIKKGWGSVKIIDQVKAFKPGHNVDANDVRALIGVLHADRSATKGIVTTTSSFAPRLRDDPFIAPFVPYRLELIDGSEVMKRLSSLTDDI